RCCFVQLRIAKVNLVTGTQDSSTYELPEHRGCRDQGHLRHRPGQGRAGPEVGRRGRPARARGLCEGRAGLRADVRDRGPRPGLHRDALGMARPGLPGGHEERQARRDRGPGGHVRSTTAGPWSRRRRSTSRHCQMMENCCYDRHRAA
ncbi:MAG: hypothetical protein MZV63_72530, partial [Marinilabiliales bacterium]|nr:hypothetical protein [Marinilabiliales bacterium]